MLENDFNIAQVWVVRERIVTEVKDRWQIPDENIFSIESTTFIGLLDQVKNYITDKG